MNEFKTLPELLQYHHLNYKNKKAVNFRSEGRWNSLSSEEFYNIVKYIALGLKDLGIKKGDSLGLIGPPSAKWLAIDLGIIISGAVMVPIFRKISEESLRFEIKNSSMKSIFIGDSDEFDFFDKEYVGLKHIITYDFENNSKEDLTLDDIIKRGKSLDGEKPDMFDKLCKKIKENDLATIIYTSGSTGIPKGVELSHKNIISQVYGAAKRFPLENGNEIALSSLPMAHIFERMVMYYYLSSGISIYFVDDIKKIGEYIRELRPTVITVVPRLLSRVHGKMKSKIENSGLIKKIIGLRALKRAETKDINEEYKGLADSIYDKLVFKKFQAALGGRFKYIISGAAPLPVRLAKFFFNIGVKLYEGYGLTEASPVLAANSPEDSLIGSVGKAFPEVTIKVASDGEILAKGPNIMSGYHKNKKDTKSTIDSKGFLHTGDLGKLTDDGFLIITGRKKELFKKETGEYVAPIPIEESLTSIDLIDMAVIVADKRPFVTALLFPDF